MCVGESMQSLFLEELFCHLIYNCRTRGATRAFARQLYDAAPITVVKCMRASFYCSFRCCFIRRCLNVTGTFLVLVPTRIIRQHEKQSSHRQSGEMPNNSQAFYPSG